MVVNFTLNEEGVAVFHDALACMFKFSDEVCLETKKDKLTLTTLNLSKSAYICFTFAANRFFSRYNFEGNAQYRDRFFCQLHIRSLMSVFRARQGGESGRDSRETTIERCDVAIDDGPGKKSRLVARINCRNGITAEHSLSFEPMAPTHAKFDKTEAVNHWTISSRTLRQLMDHFGPGIDLLDINTDDETRLVNFTCFTEKVQKRSANANEAVLKKPLHTNIAVEMDEFDDVEVEDKLHIIISVKDFRAVLQHAQIISGELATSYSNPGRPMKLSYSSEGILCEYILMTIGQDDAISQKHKNPRVNSVAARAARPELDSASRRGSSVVNASRNDLSQAQELPRVPQLQRKTALRPRHSQFDIRPQPIPQQIMAPPPPATARSDSLFVPQGDDDHQWEPINPDEEDDGGVNDRLEWNSNYEPNPSTLRINSYLNQAGEPPENPTSERLLSGLEPTQRLSEVRRYGLFSP